MKSLGVWLGVLAMLCLGGSLAAAQPVGGTVPPPAAPATAAPSTTPPAPAAPAAPAPTLAPPPLLATSPQQVSTLEVLGLAPLKQDPVEARQRAVSDALRRAVGRVALKMVDQATLRDKLAELERIALSRAREFVATYTLQAEAIQGKTALVLVSVSVDRAALDKALASAGLRLPKARLALTLVLVSEEASPGRPPVYWWSGAPGLPQAPAPLAQVLQKLGVRLADHKALAGRIPAEARQPVLNEQQALKLGRMAGAGLVILGRIRTYPLVTPQGSPPPVVQLEALETSQGKVLAMVEDQGPVYRVTPGPQAAQEVKQVVEKAMRQLLEKVAASTQETQVAQGELLLTIEGLRSLAQLHRFEQVLAGMDTLVGDIRRQSVGPGWATLRVSLKAPASRLADQLLLQDFGDFLVNVVESSPEKMKLTLIPK